MKDSPPGTTRPAREALNDPTLPGFDAYYDTTVEPPVRLPSGLGEGNPRANWLALTSAGALLLALTGYLLDAPRLLYALATLIGAATLLGALQLRMGGNGMGLAEARAHVLKSITDFLGLHHEPAPDAQALDQVFAAAGPIAATTLLRRVDLIASAAQAPSWVGVQILGGIFLDRSETALAEGRWLGVPVRDLTGRFTVDGLLARFDLPRTAPGEICVSGDRRLSFRDPAADPESAGSVSLTEPNTGDPVFDEQFRLVGAVGEASRAVLIAPLRAELCALQGRLGPVTLHIDGERAFLSVWVIGDLYELTSLGGDLRRQAAHIAWLASAPQRLAAALDAAVGARHRDVCADGAT